MGRWRFMGVILIVLFVSLRFCPKGWAEERYVVKPGDTLSAISKSFGVSIATFEKDQWARERHDQGRADSCDSHPFFNPTAPSKPFLFRGPCRLQGKRGKSPEPPKRVVEFLSQIRKREKETLSGTPDEMDQFRGTKPFASGW